MAVKQSSGTKKQSAGKASATKSTAKKPATKTASAAKKPSSTKKTSATKKTAVAKTTSTTKKTGTAKKPSVAKPTSTTKKLSSTQTSVAQPVVSENFSVADSDLKKNDKKKKILIAAAAAVLVILLLLLGGRIAKGGKSSNERNNTIALVQKYLDKGQYDDAMKLLNELLQKDINDVQADELLDKAIELKRQNQGEGSGTNVVVQSPDVPYNISIDTDQITNALMEQNERNQETINRLLEQQRLNDERFRAQQEENVLQQKAAEEQRKKEDADRKVKEEALAQKNKALKSKIDAINEKVLAGKADLNTGNIDSALNNFSLALKQLPLEEGEPEFSGSKYSEMASALYDTSVVEKDPARKQRLKDASISYVNKTFGATPNDAAAHYIMGMDYIDSGEWEKARREFESAVKSDSNNYLYYYNLGRAQFRLQKFTEARSSFDTTIKLKKDFDPAYFNLGLTCRRLKLNKEALVAFRNAHQYNPNHSRAYLEEARILNNAFNDANGALAVYNKVIELDPVNTQALNECGLVCAGLGQYSKAETYHRRAVALLKPGDKDPITYYNLATALYNQNKLADAENNAKTAYSQMDAKRKDGKALLQKADKAMIVYNYALIEDSLGNSEKAITLYKEVLTIDPDNTKTKTNLGVMFMHMTPPDPDTALLFFVDAYKVEKNFELENNLGSAYLMKKNYNNAITYFQSALKKRPKDNTVRFNLGRAYSGAGNFENAKITYLDILNIDSQNWDSYIELSKVFLALKDNKNAESYLKILQQKNPTYKKAEVDALLGAAAL